MLQQKAATSLLLKKTYEHFFCFRDLHINQNSRFLLKFVRKKNTLSTQSMNMNRKVVLQALQHCPFTKKKKKK